MVISAHAVFVCHSSVHQALFERFKITETLGHNDDAEDSNIYLSAG